MKNFALTPAAGAALALGLCAGTAHAVDGCLVMLCLAGNWKNIALCEPPVRQALRDVARGRAWPECDQGGAGNSARAVAEDCPPQYRIITSESDSGIVYGCRFTGAIESRVNGQVWSRTWWNGSGDTVVEWFSLGRDQLTAAGTPIDDQFTRDYDAWVITEEVRKAREAQAATSQSGGS